MMTIFKVLFIILIIFFIQIFYKWLKYFYIIKKIPKSSLKISFKTLWELAGGDTKKLFDKFVKNLDSDGLKRVHFGPFLFINVASPEDLQLILNSKCCLPKDHPTNNFLKVPQGLLSCSIDKWYLHRKIMNPYFGLQYLHTIIPIMNRKVKSLMENLNKMEGKGEFNIFNDLSLLAIDNILTAMDLDLDVQKNKEKYSEIFLKNFKICNEVVIERHVKFWLHPEFIFNQTNLNEKITNAVSEISKETTLKIMQQIRENQKNSNTFVQALMDPKNNLTDEEIHDEICTIILTATDTSAVTASSVILLLAMHKEIQNKVFNELKQVLGNSTEKLTLDMEMLNKLNYLEMVIKETLRLMPIGVSPVKVNKEEIISSEGYVIPAESTLLLSVYAIHRSKTIWGENANEFEPERFSNERFKKIHPYAFIPFLKGPRMCIGWRYSMILIKTLLANILLKYEIDTNLKFHELEFETCPILKVCQGYLVSIKERK
ncbi:hypothetical protein PVAND_017046 [Polypedilum vanderplanki]|uniref:Cytochrome P450 n=1 Tax=Polypedilum vanderplanki TaxID=319348 RepID=A0A9J6BHV7_POLVA|nr:hypothetical protein PVAND_017046 [Polypedilum vanderplanki]